MFFPACVVTVISTHWRRHLLGTLIIQEWYDVSPETLYQGKVTRQSAHTFSAIK